MGSRAIVHHPDGGAGAPDEAVRIADVMLRRVARVREDTDLFAAAEVVATTGVTDLMVVDDEDRFVGVLAVGDILRAALPDMDEITAASGTVDAAFRLFLERGRNLSGLPVAPLVIRDPVVVRPDDHVAKAVVVLVERAIGRLPVLDEAGTLVGTVSRADVCWAVVGVR